MLTGKHSVRSILGCLALLAAGCSSDGGSGTTATVSGAVQDLTLDPTGFTTVITLSEAPAGVTASSLQADGGQAVQSLAIAGNALTVTWSARVTPSHQVRVVGVPGISAAWRAVTTTDGAAPAFTIDSASQNPGLGGDELELAFSGPRIVRSTAEDPANWTLVVNSQTLDLGFSIFDFDENTQVLSIVLGPMANLHANFSLAATGVLSVADVPADPAPVLGVAVGDAVAPNLLSAAQNLDQDEYGRVIDFTFDKAMDPIVGAGLSRFGAPVSNSPTQVSQPAGEVLRVTFANPVIPGVHQIDLNGLVDSHGNALADGPTAITQPAPFANEFDGDPEAVTVANRGGDYVTLGTLQAFDVASAEDPANWTLVVDGDPVVLADQVLTYDFLGKTLRIELDFDMLNGTGFTVTGNGVLEVDGQAFNGSFNGTVAGDDVAPTVVDIVQNRNLDPSGRTLQLAFSEDLGQASAETTGNYVPSDNSISVLTATLLPNGSGVRLTLDHVAVPGLVTFTVQGVDDLAGNSMPAPQVGIAITSTDSTPPVLNSATAQALEGMDNDRLSVVFSDYMVEDDVLDASNWSFESPVGTPLDLDGCTFGYDSVNRSATVILNAGGLSLQRDTDFRLELSFMRDIAGIEIAPGAISGDVLFERSRPTIVSIWRDSVQTNQVEVRFSEPCAYIEDLYDPVTNPTGTRYTLWDGIIERGYPSAAAAVDGGLGARLTFGFLVSLTDTMDVYGLADSSGNFMLPVAGHPITAQDPAAPSLDTGSSTLTAVSGEANDELVVRFDVPLSPWRLLEPSNYTLTSGGQPVSLDGAEFEFDGDRTVTVRFGSGSGVNLQSSALYDLSVNDVQSAQGVQRTLPDDEVDLPVDGDVTAPVVGLSDVRLDPSDPDSLLVFASEALDEDSATNPAAYDYQGGTLATQAVLLSPRVVRVTFPGPVAEGHTLEFTLTDLAGNVSGAISRSVDAADTQPPLLASVAGVSVPGKGGDLLRISFDEPVDLSIALDPSNYTVTNGGNPVSLTGASAIWESSTLTVVIRLADDVALNPNQAMAFTVRNVADWSGNAISSAGVTLGGAASGDTTPPALAAAFLNWRHAADGRVVDVIFSEGVRTEFSSDPLNWSSSGGQSVLEVLLLEDDAVRVVLSGALGIGQEVHLAGGLSDPAGNVAGPISFTPDR